MSLHNRIFVGMAVGLALGLGLNALANPEGGLYINMLWWLDLFGKTIFVGGLKMIIAPLIFASIVAGISTLPNMRELGNIGGKTILYYVCTTTIAVAIGVAAVLIIRPGKKRRRKASGPNARRRSNCTPRRLPPNKGSTRRKMMPLSAGLSASRRTSRREPADSAIGTPR
jgi:Na+/H+-dicarboxylate symporter